MNNAYIIINCFNCFNSMFINHIGMPDLMHALVPYAYIYMHASMQTFYITHTQMCLADNN